MREQETKIATCSVGRTHVVLMERRAGFYVESWTWPNDTESTEFLRISPGAKMRATESYSQKVLEVLRDLDNK